MRRQPEAAARRPLPRRRPVEGRRRRGRCSALWGGLLAGLVHRPPACAPARTSRAGVGRRAGPASSSAGSGRCCVGVAVLLVAVDAPSDRGSPSSAIVVAAVLGRLARRRRRPCRGWPTVARRCCSSLVLAAVPVALIVYLAGVLGWDEWGGFMINVFIAAAAIVLCFPLGVLLALGRRSKLPLLRGDVHASTSRSSAARRCSCCCCSPTTRSSSSCRRRSRPASSSGRSSSSRCSPPPTSPRSCAAACSRCRRARRRRRRRSACRRSRTTFLIVLPQALRNVIPAQIGQFISLFKDITLAGAAMGVFELLDVVARRSPSSPTSPASGSTSRRSPSSRCCSGSVRTRCRARASDSRRRLGVGTR